MPKIKEMLKVIGGEGGSNITSSGELDKTLDEIYRMQANKMKMAQIREYTIESENRIKKLEKDSESGVISIEGSPQTSIQDIEVAKQLATLPDLDRAKIMGIMTTLKSSGKGGAEATMLPIIMATMLSNPKATEQDSAKIVIDTMSAMGGLLKQFTPQESSKNDTADLIRAIASVMKPPEEKKSSKDEIVDSLIKTTIEQLTKPQQGWMDRILDDPTALARLKSFTGGDNKETMELRRLMENDNRNFQLLLKRIELDTQLKLLGMQRDTDRSSAIEKGIRQVVSAAAEALGGEEQTVQPMQSPSQRQMTPSRIEAFKCGKCGKEVQYESGAVNVSCLSCGQGYDLRIGEVTGEDKGATEKSP